MINLGFFLRFFMTRAHGFLLAAFTGIKLGSDLIVCANRFLSRASIARLYRARY